MEKIIENYKPFDKFLLRSPLLPLQQINEFTLSKLKDLFINPLISESIYIASPILYEECNKWVNNEIKNSKETDRIIYSLMRYLLRMSTRCTPFGLFAGCTSCTWNSNSSNSKEIILKPIDKYYRHTRLDMHFLCSLANDLSTNPSICNNILFFPNSSIYYIGKKLRYIEYKYINNKRIHQISSVNYSEHIQKVLSSATNGSMITTMANILVDNEISLEEATEFIHELIISQILVSELEPAITGPEFLDQMLNVLDSISDVKEIKEVLINTKLNIQKIDKKSNENISIYYKISEDLKKLKTPFELNYLFQTDMIKPILTNNLNNSIASDVLRGISVLGALNSTSPKTLFNQFRKAFYERYEDREISLLEALDNETGIGYIQDNGLSGDITPLIENIAIPSFNLISNEIVWDNVQSYLLSKYLNSLQSQQYEVEITEKELEHFRFDFENLPDTFSAIVHLLNDKIYISSAGGSSAANIVGRFCHSDEMIYNYTKEIIAKETEINPNAIFAEIIHLPESRIGNILLRPVLREYEIPFLGKTYVDTEHQIKLTDLMISVRGEKVILRSKRLNKEVLPRLSTAHNYSYNSLPVYHFLCDLQLQNRIGGISFNWGVLHKEYKFLPRVIYRNIILSLAQWNLRKDDFKILTEYNNENILSIVDNWRNKYKIPRYIALVDGDNELVIDLENVLCTKTFIDEIKNRSIITIVEFIFDPDKSVVKSVDGSYANQLIIPFHRIKKDNPVPSLNPNSFNEVNIKRTFITGDEWLYLKFYIGVKTSDYFLTEFIKPLTAELIQQGVIDKWFFIRYFDPNYHIRLRFHGIKRNSYHQILDRLFHICSDLILSKNAYRIQTDTYNREIERYGLNTIDLSESIFFHDSQFIIQLIDMIEGYDGEKYRWLIGLRSIDEFLNNFKFDIYKKKELMNLFSENFYKEFNMNKDSKAQLGHKYRKEKILIENLLNRSNDINSPISPLLKLINIRTDKTQNIVDELLCLNSNGQLQIPVGNLVNSYLHMFCNRLFRSKQRLHEMVLYTYLMKYYESQIARNKTLIDGSKNPNRNLTITSEVNN